MAVPSVGDVPLSEVIALGCPPNSTGSASAIRACRSASTCKVTNLGSHRWSAKPEIGLGHASGRWVVEVMAGVWLFTDNIDFNVRHTRAQDPIGSAQAHVTYRFSPRVWLAGDANSYTGGRTRDGPIVGPPGPSRRAAKTLVGPSRLGREGGTS